MGEKSVSKGVNTSYKMNENSKRKTVSMI